MGKTGERYIFLRIAYAVGKLQWCVFCSQHMYLLGREIAYLCIKEFVQLISQLLDAHSPGDGSSAYLFHFSAQYGIVHLLGVFVAIVWFGSILIDIMYQHRTHAPHADGLASLGEIVL